MERDAMGGMGGMGPIGRMGPMAASSGPAPPSMIWRPRDKASAIIPRAYRCAGAQSVRTYSSTASSQGRGVSPVTDASFRVLMAV